MTTAPLSTPQPPVEILKGWILRSLENAVSGETITRLMLDYYNLTGEWPDPKLVGPSNPRPTMRVVDPWESPVQNFQPPLPGIARPVILPDGIAVQRQSKYRVTGYDYRHHSPYRREAARLLLPKIAPEKRPEGIEARLELGELEEVEKEMGLHLPLGCLDLLTLILAWSHLPLFLDGSSTALGWMTLSLKRMARELGVKSDTVYSWLRLLQHYEILGIGNLQTGIIKPQEYELLKVRVQNLSRGKQSSGDLFTGRAIQTSSTFYRVKPQVSPLPPFQPGTPEYDRKPTTGTPGGYVGDTLGRLKVTLNKVGDTLKSGEVAPNQPGDTSQVIPTYPPGLHNDELIHEHDDDEATKSGNFEGETIKNETSNRFEAEMQLFTPEQRENYNLLSTIHEKIPGYNRRGMDGGEVLKLATGYTNVYLTEITTFFLEWVGTGKHISNPIGYLHTLITKGIQPQTTITQEEQTAQGQRAASYRREPRGQHHNKPGQKFKPYSPASIEHLVQDPPEPVSPLPKDGEGNPGIDLGLKRQLVLIDRKAEWLSRFSVCGETFQVKFAGQTPDFNRVLWLSVVQRLHPNVHEIVVL